MRILHVSQPTTYGLERYLTDLLTDHATRGWTVALASPASEELMALCTRLGVTHHEWAARRDPGPSTVREVRALRRIVRDVSPDVIQLHSSKAGFAGRIAVRAKRPTVFTPHAWSFFHEGPITRFLARTWERWATRWADVILCGSEGERDAGERAGLRATWAVVPNAVDLERFRPADDEERARLRTSLGIDGSHPVVVCVGRLAPQKGQDLLLQAWPDVVTAVPDAVLFLVGEGPDAEALQAMAVPGVHFAGRQADPRPWLVAADLVVQPSRWETLSLSALEALACGRNVVASDVFGMREVIGQGPEAAGEVVPVGDIDALARAIVARLRDPALSERERAGARARVAGYGTAEWGPKIARVLEAAARR